MILLFDMEEASTILSALSDMDDFFLPKSVSRNDLHTLASKFVHVMGLKLNEDGEMPILNLFLDRFDATELAEIHLTPVELNYVICALHAIGFEDTGYPERINLAASRAFNKTNAPLVEGVIDHLERGIWDVTARDKRLSGSVG